jgi:hypothetical protein
VLLVTSLVLAFGLTSTHAGCQVYLEVFDNIDCPDDFSASAWPHEREKDQEGGDEHGRHRGGEHAGREDEEEEEERRRTTHHPRRDRAERGGEGHTRRGSSRLGCATLSQGCNRLTMMSGYYLLRVNCTARSVGFVGDDECVGPATVEWGGNSSTACGSIAPTLSFRTTFLSSSSTSSPDPLPTNTTVHSISLDDDCSAAPASWLLWRRHLTSEGLFVLLLFSLLLFALL